MKLLQSVQVGQLPQSTEEFIVLRDRIAQAPQGGAAMMIVALLVYAEDEDIGWQCLSAAVDRERLEEGPRGYRGRRLRASDARLIESQVGKQPYLPRSYVEGATPENGYRLPAVPYELAFSANPYSGDPDSGTYKVFSSCSGASSPRPITVRRNERGLWKAYEWSSLLVGVMKPERMMDQL